jgi:hypothetical protein
MLTTYSKLFIRNGSDIRYIIQTFDYCGKMSIDCWPIVRSLHSPGHHCLLVDVASGLQAEESLHSSIRGDR